MFGNFIVVVLTLLNSTQECRHAGLCLCFPHILFRGSMEEERIPTVVASTTCCCVLVLACASLCVTKWHEAIPHVSGQHPLEGGPAVPGRRGGLWLPLGCAEAEAQWD